jgi:flagellar secretion chaperone FliS
LKQNPYATSKVMTADRGQILLMLYDGAIRFNEAARQCLEGGRSGEAMGYLRRTLSIVQELKAVLDPRHAPELCANLERLYTFMEDQILRAQQGGAEPLASVGEILRDLRATWAEALEQLAAAHPNQRTA